MNSITITKLTQDYLRDADCILQAAFGSPDSRLEDLRRLTNLQPEGWFLATMDGKPVGTIGAMDYGDFAYIGMMAVHPDSQRKGIATQLMKRILDWVEGRGCRISLLDATSMGEPIYRRFGFIEVDRSQQFTRKNHSMTAYIPPAVSELRPQDIPALKELDLMIFGADRLTVIQAYLVAFPGRGFLVRDEKGEVSGYLLVQHRKLGPWVARTPWEAEALLQAALTLPYPDGAPVALVPAANSAATSLLERFGFKADLSLPHMQRGGARHPCQRNLVFGQTSFAIG